MPRHVLAVAFAVSLVAALGVPRAAHAGSLVKGMTSVRVENDPDQGDGLRLTFTVAGPAEGPLKVGIAHGHHIEDPVEVPFDALSAGAYRSMTARIPIDGRPGSHYRIGVEDPKGAIGFYDATIRRGPDQETYLGDQRKVTHTWYDARRADAGLGWVDDTTKVLAVEFFLEVRHPGSAVDVTFHVGKQTLCSDHLTATGVRGQVVHFRAYCRGAEKKAKPQTELEKEGVTVSDDSGMYDKTYDGDNVDINADAVSTKDAMRVKQALVHVGTWRVEVKTGRHLRRVLTFKVTHKGVRASLKRKGPMKAVKVKVVRR